MSDPQKSSPQHPGRDNVLSTAALRALAHPLRIRILDELSMFGPLTASGLGERLGESSGATSYHLRQLEKHGLVREDTARGNARERWWERRPGSISTPEVREFPPGSAERQAAQLVEDEWFRGREANAREFAREGDAVFGDEWLDAAAFDVINLRLTAEQLHQIVQDIDVVLWKYIDAYKKTPSEGALPVQMHISAFPLVRGAESAGKPGKTTGNVGGGEKNS
ncbi:MAG: helix-turn-helix domain-containing protein [Pseudolysinimonas sp.]